MPDLMNYYMNMQVNNSFLIPPLNRFLFVLSSLSNALMIIYTTAVICTGQVPKTKMELVSFVVLLSIIAC